MSHEFGDLRHGHDLVARLLDLWATPVTDPTPVLPSFAALYTDPVTINGTAVPLTALVDRATALHAALDGIEATVLEVVEAPGKVVVVFELAARHVGPWHSPVGELPATGRSLHVRAIDVLTVVDGRVAAIWVISDEVSMIDQMGARVRAS